MQFSASNYLVSETSGSAVVTVTRTGGTGPASVRYAASNGTAAAPSDFTARSGTLSWAAGDTSSKTFTVPIINDWEPEEQETIRLTLSSPTGAVLGLQLESTMTIGRSDNGTGGCSPICP